MIREASGVGVVLVNDETALVIQQSVKDMRRFVCRCHDDLRVIRPKLIGHMGVELHARFRTIAEVHHTPDFPATTGTKELTIRRGSRAAAPVNRQRLAMSRVQDQVQNEGESSRDPLIPRRKSAKVDTADGASCQAK